MYLKGQRIYIEWKLICAVYNILKLWRKGFDRVLKAADEAKTISIETGQNIEAIALQGLKNYFIFSQVKKLQFTTSLKMSSIQKSLSWETGSKKI